MRGFILAFALWFGYVIVEIDLVFAYFFKVVFGEERMIG